MTSLKEELLIKKDVFFCWLKEMHIITADTKSTQ